MNFLTEDPPPRGIALPVLPGIRRIVADNPGPMTYRGTNTYLLDWDDGVAVLDPGPDNAVHVRDILDQAGAPIKALVLTHGHHDHAGALPALRAATGAPLHAWPTLGPDIALQHGVPVGPFQAIHTPGHAPDHLCFARPDGVVFSGDHVMSWSSTVVGGEGGDMSAYFQSLHRLLEIDSKYYLPGHGPLLPDPLAFTRALLEHRRDRERAILDAMTDRDVTAADLVAILYRGLDPSLSRAAEANVIAHLRKLQQDGRVQARDARWARMPQS